MPAVRRGWITILVALLQQALLPVGAFVLKPWPDVPEIEARCLFFDLEVRYRIAA
jgi:hypothetical protein